MLNKHKTSLAYRPIIALSFKFKGHRSIFVVLCKSIKLHSELLTLDSTWLTVKPQLMDCRMPSYFTTVKSANYFSFSAAYELSLNIIILNIHVHVNTLSVWYTLKCGCPQIFGFNVLPSSPLQVFYMEEGLITTNQTTCN